MDNVFGVMSKAAYFFTALMVTRETISRRTLAHVVDTGHLVGPPCRGRPCSLTSSPGRFNALSQ